MQHLKYNLKSELHHKRNKVILHQLCVLCPEDAHTACYAPAGDDDRAEIKAQSQSSRRVARPDQDKTPRHSLLTPCS